jgi:hypothetical protein
MKFILLILAVSFLFPCCSRKDPGELNFTMPEIINYLPANSGVIAYCNLDEIRRTNFKDDLADGSLGFSSRWLEELEVNTGIGLVNGFSEVCTGKSLEGSTVTILSISGERNKIRNYFSERENFSIKDKDGNNIFKLDEDPSLYFYILKDSILFVSDYEEYILSLNENEKKPPAKNKNILEAAVNIAGKNHFWIATDQPSFGSLFLKKIFGVDETEKIKGITGYLRCMSIGIFFSDKAELTSVLSCSSTKNAFVLSSAIKGALALDLLSVRKYELKEILEKVKLDRDNDDIFVNVNLEADDIRKFKKNSNIDLNWNNL